MPATRYYDVYDTKDNTLMLHCVTRKEISEYFRKDVPKMISKYADCEWNLFDRYKIVHVDAPDRFTKEWNRAIEPFRHVQWVKKDGRKLTIKECGKDEGV